MAYLGHLKLLLFPMLVPEPDGRADTLFGAPRRPHADAHGKPFSIAPLFAGGALLAAAGREPESVPPLPEGGDGRAVLMINDKVLAIVRETYRRLLSISGCKVTP